MNFKTTIVLLVLLVLAATAVIVTQHHAASEPQTTPPPIASVTPGNGPKLLPIAAADVTRIAIVGPNGEHTTAQQINGAWRLSEPIDAPAVEYATTDLIRTITDLRSLGQPDASSNAASQLDHPRWRIELTTSDGHTTTLEIGNKTGVGDVMYARAGGGDVNLIDAAIDKSLSTAATDLRDKRLLTINPTTIKQFRIVEPHQTLAAEEVDGKWRITSPTPMPGDAEQISSLLGAITATEATAFVKADSDELAFANFNHPTLQVWLSADEPASRPAATAPAGVTLTVGSPSGLSRDQYFVETDTGDTATISKDALAAMQKTPLDLRDRAIFTVDPTSVDKVTILKQTFLPVPGAAKVKQTGSFTTILQRRAPAPTTFGPESPIKSKSRPAATAATEPAPKPGAQLVWQFQTDGSHWTDADDAKVATVLADFQPLHAEKFLTAIPAATPSTTFTVSLSTGQTVKFVRLSNGGNPYATYNGMIFEVSETILESFDADFHKGSAPTTPAPQMGAPPIP